MARVAIAGAGLTGRLFAWALAREGHSVSVFDPAPDAGARGAAAFTAAGMLSPLAELESTDADVAALGWTSLRLWPAIAPEQLRRDGSLLLAHRSDLGAAQRVLARIGRFEMLDRAALQALEPALAPGLLGWHLPGEGSIDAPAALAHLARAPAEWCWGQRVESIEPGRLHLADGRTVVADWAIDARGLGASWPLRGVRGEIVTLDLPGGHGLQRPLRLLHPRQPVYLVPRGPERLLVGASEIESEDRSAMSLRSAVELMAAAHSVLPALAEARIALLDVNLRPALPDNRPLAHCEPGLLTLNGLYRHGWLLAPALVQQLLRESGLGALPEETHA
ncbi:FAD-dependent oxidoreductase [Paucibacter sp. R3-3]|uniref:FAD-dependent oxidoreductase n=1 Tax=Roseateles agri TaxID=3098619 RepID=A0ABU5DCJ5_9BURK|nr:FAD-dependent oxidoreductase [Paucibacter sp. R3-3]MDY0742932.1 FAD-dependent oxidoreductase [Paucibacter sp. R3-3]